MGRLLAIDYGKKRTGIAVSDPLQLIANPLTTVETKGLMAYLQAYCQREEVQQFVVGKPMQTNGRPSENLARVEQFVAKLAQTMPTIPIIYVDERYTSVLAHQAMLQSGISKKRRQDKALVDEISACIILQTYMESHKHL